MGEAKRRKALGLMPQVIAFEGRLSRAGVLELHQGSVEPQQQALIEGSVQRVYVQGAAWDSQYRTLLVLSGQQDGVLSNAEEVRAIPVPEWRLVRGELVLGAARPAGEQAIHPVDGGFVRYHSQQHSFDGRTWASLPNLGSPEQLQERVQRHPAFELEGEVVGQYHLEHWATGRIDIDPDPPEELLELLEEVITQWHGSDQERWQRQHALLLEQRESPAPLARRSVLELRRPAPLHHPARLVLDIRRELEYLLVSSGAYTLDGETWLSYADDSPLPEAEPGLDLGQLFDLATVQVTVHQDGRIEWPEGALTAEQRQRLDQNLRASSGAGDPAAWAQWCRRGLEVALDHSFQAPEGQAVPVPIAVRLDVPQDALDDHSPLSQVYLESEVLFEGGEWRDLYDEALPPELEPYAVPPEEADG